MDTKKIPSGWWLNVTIMARKDEPSWIVGVIREGKTTWITETAKGDFNSSEEAYKWGINFINRYNN